MIYFIMPVGSDPNYSAKRERIEKILKRHGRVGHFPLEQITSSEFRLAETMGDLQVAGMIVADLALERPSCYFEVGLAQALGKEVQLIAPEGTDIHQVAGRTGVLFYGNDREYENLVDSLVGGR